MNLSTILTRVLPVIFTFLPTFLQAQNRPNILIIIADDMGIDAFSPYQLGMDQPHTPNLNSLASQGLLFNNAWAYATCAPSRASALTGRYGNKSSITRSGFNLPDEEVSLFEYIDTLTNGAYADAAFGKWHLGRVNSPNQQGADYFTGSLLSGVGNYYKWERTTNGVQDTSETYVTSYITDEAISWINNQNQPWIAWVAHNAPHGPNHLPPDSLYTRTQTNSNFDEYLCMIEGVDHEVGRLYNSLSQAEKDSTIIIFFGDNGTPNASLQAYPRRHGKSSLYEGGLRVPMFMTGYGVERKGEQEAGMVAVADIFATLAALLGDELEGGYHNSFSLLDVLTDSNAVTRPYNYSELGDSAQAFSRAIRDEQHKLIIRENASGIEMEFFDLQADPLEFTELLAGGLTSAQSLAMDKLKAEADSIFLSWSCNDLIRNGDEEGIDCGGSACAPCQTTHLEQASSDFFTLYPNPAHEYVRLDVSAGDYHLVVRDACGKEVHTQSLKASSLIDLRQFSSGIYIFQLIDNHKHTSHFVKMLKH